MVASAWDLAQTSVAETIASSVVEIHRSGAAMNRTTIRVAAIVLATGMTYFELLGIERLAEHSGPAGDSIVVLPRVTITAAGVDDLGHYFDGPVSAAQLEVANRPRR